MMKDNLKGGNKDKIRLTKNRGEPKGKQKQWNNKEKKGKKVKKKKEEKKIKK